MKYRFRFDRPGKRFLLNGFLIIMIIVIFIWGIMLGRNGSGDGEDDAADGPPGMSVESPVMVRIYDHEQDKIITMELEEYICHVVAAEMPASYEMEALKAQAVAARTLAAETLEGGSRGCTQGADLCTSSEHCQAYAGTDTCRERWGSEYDRWWQRICDAVYGTTGMIMTYQGEPIEVFYHAVSGGQTEDVENVFSEQLPYLRSVSSEGEENENHYRQELSFTYQDFIDRVRQNFPGANLDAGKLADQVKIVSHFDSGRVHEVQLGGLTVGAVELRWALGLPSTWFTIGYSGTDIIFDCLGYGHGVGMSQAGANVMARTGSDYEEILNHYFTGITIETMDIQS